ncbi:MarR family winged helix-turn-helix transcriptional regulator [Amorphus coralli]|uniref:MarR family winged helix-turn-helix transcriptional regulator n=1 Tax=Amorphus coralli TaxID=340680 RepID=UPI000375B237|nr:MarR family transcriptional regulator [Amorphus coralli]
MPQDFTLDDFLPYLINVLGTRLSVELGAEYGRRFAITIPEWRVLAHLSQHERVSVREIYRRVEMDKAKVSRAAARLEAAGLIRKEVPEDRRLVALSLTPKGQTLMAEIAPLALDFETRFLERLTPEEARTFRDLVGKLLR